MNPTGQSICVAPSLVEIRVTDDKGLGVFARQAINHGTLIERAPVILFPEHELYSPRGTAKIAKYVFVWDEGIVGFVHGYGSLYNHAVESNAVYQDVHVHGTPCKQFVAIRDISAGEEVTINYNGSPADGTDPGFIVLE